MKLTVTESVSLDGVMQGLGGPDEDRRGGFERGGWRTRLDEGCLAFLNEVARADAFLFGQRTYGIFAGSRHHDGSSQGPSDGAELEAQVRRFFDAHRATLGGTTVIAGDVQQQSAS